MEIGKIGRKDVFMSTTICEDRLSSHAMNCSRGKEWYRKSDERTRRMSGGDRDESLIVMSNTRRGCLSPQSSLSVHVADRDSSTYSYGVLMRMPACVQLKGQISITFTRRKTHDLLCEIDIVRLQSLLLSWNLASRTTNLLCFECRLVGLEHNIIITLNIIDAEVVVI